MTPSELRTLWQTAVEPQRMLELLGMNPDRRKLRLFACACARQVERHLIDPASRRAVVVAERYADGEASGNELQAASDQAQQAADRLAFRVNDGNLGAEVAALQDARVSAAFAACNCTLPSAVRAADYSSANAASAVFHAASSVGNLPAGMRRAEARAEQCSFLREIFGDPWAGIRALPEWLAWNDGTVFRLAQAIYTERAYDRLPILADALEDAGCTQPALLEHCREEGQHHLGCWALDLLRRQ